MGILEDWNKMLKEKPLATKEQMQVELAGLLGLAAGNYLVSGVSPAVYDAIVKIMAAARLKNAVAVTGAVAGVVGYASWAGWAQKEALEPSSMAVRTAIAAGNYKVAREALDKYEAMYESLKNNFYALENLPLGFGAGMTAFADSQAANIDSYESALAGLALKTGATAAAVQVKGIKAVSAKQNAVYEADALEAMNAGDLKVGRQWLDKITDFTANAAATKRVIKAESATHKAGVVNALLLADVAGAQKEAALILDVKAKASADTKIAAFQAKAAAKVQAAQAKVAKAAVVAQNKATQKKTRVQYFVDAGNAQASSRAAAAGPGEVSGARGTVQYFGNPGEANYGQYWVFTGTGSAYKTTSAALAAAVANAEGVKVTPEGLAAGR